MILLRYLGREIFYNFVVSLVVLNFLLLLTRMATLLIQLAPEKLCVLEYLRLFSFLAPMFFSFTIPLAALTGTVLGFMRLSQDGEILAFQSLGIPFRKLLQPVVLLGLVALGLSFAVTLKYLPWSKARFRSFVYQLTKKKIARGLPAKTFVNWLPGLAIFVQKTSPDGKAFERVFMVDETNPARRGLIFASHGDLRLRQSYLIFRLFDGCMHLVDQKLSRTEELCFQEYVYRVDLSHLTQKRHPSRGELGLSALRQKALSYPPGSAKRLKYRIEYWKRLAFPWAALVLTLLGAPLGALVRASGKGAGLGLAGLTFLGYYVLFSLGANLAQKQVLPPALGLNLPNFVLGLLLLLLVWALEKGRIGQPK